MTTLSLSLAATAQLLLLFYDSLASILIHALLHRWLLRKRKKITVSVIFVFFFTHRFSNLLIDLGKVKVRDLIKNQDEFQENKPTQARQFGERIGEDKYSIYRLLFKFGKQIPFG